MKHVKINKDQTLLERAYEYVYTKKILNEYKFDDFNEASSAINKQIDDIVNDTTVADWMKKRVSKAISQSNDRDINDIINTRDYSFTNQFRDKLVSMRDYIKSLDEREQYKALRGDFNAVNAKAEKWHEDLAKGSGVAGQDISVSKYFEDTEPYFDLKNGWKIVRLTSQAACKLEGGEMGHCVGGGGYTPQNILSLRDPKGRPHATIEIRRVGPKIEIHQIKGKQNKSPKDEYKQMVREMIRSNPEKYVVKADAENIGFVTWDNRGYDPDSSQWQQVLKTKVIPKRDKIKNEILSRITT